MHHLSGRGQAPADFFDLKINTEAGEHPVRVGAVVVAGAAIRDDAQRVVGVDVAGRTQPRVRGTSVRRRSSHLGRFRRVCVDRTGLFITRITAVVFTIRWSPQLNIDRLIRIAIETARLIDLHNAILK